MIEIRVAGEQGLLSDLGNIRSISMPYRSASTPIAISADRDRRLKAASELRRVRRAERYQEATA